MAAQVGPCQHTGVAKQPEGERYGLKAAGNYPTENRLRRRHLVHVERLRVMRKCEVNNRTLGESNPTGLEGIAD